MRRLLQKNRNIFSERFFVEKRNNKILVNFSKTIAITLLHKIYDIIKSDYLMLSFQMQKKLKKKCVQKMQWKTLKIVLEMKSSHMRHLWEI